MDYNRIEDYVQMDSVEIRKRRVIKVIRTLKKLFPRARIALKHSNVIQLLASVILSAQCTDKKVNEVTQKLFKKYKTAQDFASADLKTFEREIRPTGFYRAKAKNILGACRIIVEKFNGKLPRTMEEILTLPGVGRKTANIVLYNGYGILSGIAVDTHMRRINKKLGLTSYDDPDKIEQDLIKIIPRRYWGEYPYLIIEYGRKFCPARHKNCDCGIYKIR